MDTGTALPALPSDALRVSRNTEHMKSGSITKRPGRSVLAEVAAQPSPFCSPLLDSEFFSTSHLHSDDGGLTLVGGFELGETYYARVTYVTAAGETDDLHSSDPDNPGPAELSWVATNNSARIAAPFHIRNILVEERTVNPAGYLQIRLAQPDPLLSTGAPVTVCDPDIFIGWLVYSRSPRIQDETNLGANEGSATPLYHRTVPFARVTFYDQTSRILTLDRRLEEVGLTGWLDRDHVDLMMPDRDGLPILSFNVYTSDDGVDFFYAGTGIDGASPVDVFDVDHDAVRAPSTRVDRSAPTVVAVQPTELVDGLCGPQIGNTRIPGGVYGVRTTWTCGDIAIMGDPGFERRCELLGIPRDEPPIRCEQETWPSRETQLAVPDGWGLQVTPPPGPEINSGWSVYVRQLRPLLTVTFEDSVRENGAVALWSPRWFDQSSAFFYDSLAGNVHNETFTESPEDLWGINDLCQEFQDTSNIIANNLDPFDPSTRGFEPGYPDIRETLDINGNPEFSFASSKDAIPNNYTGLWFRLNRVTQALPINTATFAVLRLSLRIRPGKQFPVNALDTQFFMAGDDRHVNVRYWDETGGTWVTLRSNMGISDADSFTEIAFPFAWDRSYLLRGEDQFNVPQDWTFLIASVDAFNSVGFDVTWPCQLELYGPDVDTEDDPIPSRDSVLQRGGISPIQEDSYTLQNPLVERTQLTDGTDVTVGEWESIWPNNTAQWPVVVASLPIVGRKASKAETKTNFIGCADSTFQDAGDGTVERLFQEEGEHWNACMRHDWRFENYLNRVFFLNEGETRWNYRYDGLAVYPMGLGKPISGVSLDDIDDGFGVSQGELPPPTLYGDRCLEAELFAGQIIEVTQTHLQEGQVDPDGNVVLGMDLEYYVVYKRLDPATGRSYVVRSEPSPFTRTLRVRGTDDFEPIVAVEGWLSPEPQVTHIEFYRNSFATADYFLVSDLIIGPDGTIPDYSDEGVRITDEVVDPATCRVHIQFGDVISVTGADLTLPIEFETGRPTAAVMMKFNAGRVFFVQQIEREIIAWTNITSPSGDVNPEGFSVYHVQDPPLRESSAITCLSVYNDNVVASCNTGMVLIQSISDQLNSGAALSFTLAASNGGWMGPDAYTDKDNVQVGMTRQGPALFAGSELDFAGPEITGTLEEAILDTETLFNCRCVLYRVHGRSQVWFTFKTDPNECITKVLVYDDHIDAKDPTEMYWKEWSEMPVHGLSSARDSDGNEFPCLGGQNGRTYRHGLAATDAGLLIEHDIVTRPFESPTPSATFMPRWAYFYTSGEPDDLMMLDIRADFEDIARNQQPIPVPMGGDSDVIWGNFVWGVAESIWGGDGERPWTDQRISMGGTFQQIAYRLYMTWDVWPIGKSRAIAFESTGFNPYDSTLGPRPARAAYIGKTL